MPVTGTSYPAPPSSASPLPLPRCQCCASRDSLAVHRFSLTGCRKFRTQLHDLSVRAKKLDHVQPILQSLHCLPIRARIQYKLSTLCFNVITGTEPQYLSELLHLYTPSRDLRSSADARILKIPRSIQKHLVRDHSDIWSEIILTCQSLYLDRSSIQSPPF